MKIIINKIRYKRRNFNWHSFFLISTLLSFRDDLILVTNPEKTRSGSTSWKIRSGSTLLGGIELLFSWQQSRVYKEVTQLSDFFVTTTISLQAKLLSHRDVLFFLYGVCRLPLVKCKLRTMIYYHWQQSRLAPRLLSILKMATSFFTILVKYFVVCLFWNSFPCLWLWRASLTWTTAIRLLLQLSHCPIQIQSTHYDLTHCAAN
jgi:hypothetical protein